MNAAIAVDRHSVAEVPVEHQTDAVVEPGTAAVTPAENDPPSFGSVMAISVPIAMVAFFVLTTVGMTAYRGDFVGALGLAAYLAIWTGLGFGFIFGGAYWAMQQPHD